MQMPSFVMKWYFGRYILVAIEIQTLLHALFAVLLSSQQNDDDSTTAPALFYPRPSLAWSSFRLAMK